MGDRTWDPVTRGSRAVSFDNTDVFSARVVRRDTSGVWVVTEGGDDRHPIGPLLGAATFPAAVPGALVLVIETADGAWIAGVD